MKFSNEDYSWWLPHIIWWCRHLLYHAVFVIHVLYSQNVLFTIVKNTVEYVAVAKIYGSSLHTVGRYLSHACTLWSNFSQLRGEMPKRPNSHKKGYVRPYSLHRYEKIRLVKNKVQQRAHTGAYTQTYTYIVRWAEVTFILSLGTSTMVSFFSVVVWFVWIGSLVFCGPSHNIPVISSRDRSAFFRSHLIGWRGRGSNPWNLVYKTSMLSTILVVFGKVSMDIYFRGSTDDDCSGVSGIIIIDCTVCNK